MAQHIETEGLKVVTAYSDIIEYCGYLEFRQGVSRDLISQALISAALRMCGSQESFVKAIEDAGHHFGAVNGSHPVAAARDGRAAH